MSIEIRITPMPPPPRWVGHNVPTREISAVQTNLSFVFQNVYKQICPLFTKHFEWTHLTGRHVLSRWQGIMGFLVFSPPRYAVPVLDTLCLSSMRCGCPRYAVPVRDTLCMSAIRCACPKYAMPVLNTLCLSLIRSACPKYAVPVLNTLCLSAIRCACPKYVELSFRCACP